MWRETVVDGKYDIRNVKYMYRPKEKGEGYEGYILYNGDSEEDGNYSVVCDGKDGMRLINKERYKYILNNFIEITEWEYSRLFKNEELISWHVNLKGKTEKRIQKLLEVINSGNGGEEEEREAGIRLLEMSLFEVSIKELQKKFYISERYIRKLWERVGVTYGEFFGVFVTGLQMMGNYGTEDVVQYLLMIRDEDNHNRKQVADKLRGRIYRSSGGEDKLNKFIELYKTKENVVLPSIVNRLEFKKRFHWEIKEGKFISKLRVEDVYKQVEEFTREIKVGKGFIPSSEDIDGQRMLLENDYRKTVTSRPNYYGVIGSYFGSAIVRKNHFEGKGM